MQPQRNAEPVPVLEIARSFDAPPERVFDAWLGLQWARWLPPADARCQVSVIEPRVAGRYRLTMTMPDGRVVEISGVYREVTRPSKLVFTWFADYNRRETLITVTFQAQGTGTVMSFRQEGFATLEMRDRYGGGWGGANGSFDKLARCLADAAAATR